MRRLQKKKKNNHFLPNIVIAIICAFSFVACNANSSKNKYILAEQLVFDAKYEAAVHEFGLIVKREPLSKLGKLSLYQMGLIQHYYIGQPEEAHKTYSKLLERIKEDKDWRIKVLVTLGSLYFDIFEDYEKAIKNYNQILKLEPHAALKDQIVFKMGKSLYMLSRFKEAIKVFTFLDSSTKTAKLKEKANFEIANSYSSNGDCKKAVKYYRKVSKTEESRLKNLAVFGEAICFEELDDLDKAYDLFASIQESYPTPRVIELKLKKIKRRKILRRR